MTDIKLHSDGPVDVSLGGLGLGPGPEGAKQISPKVLPILPVRDLSIFPRMLLPMLLNAERHSLLVDHVVAGERLMGLVTMREGVEQEAIKGLEDIHQVGIAVLVVKMAKDDDEGDGQGIRLIAQGLFRFRILELLRTEPYLMARVESLPDVVNDSLEAMALFNNLRGLLKKVMELAPHLPDELKALVSSIEEPGPLCDLAASALNLSPAERQTIIEAVEVKERLRLMITLVNREIQVLELGSKIQSQVKEGLDKTQREFYLRQQMDAIKKELGEHESQQEGETDELARKLAEKELPESVRTEAEKELGRMTAMQPASAEYHVIATYLDWILQLPWMEASQDKLDIKEARAILEADHYDLDRVKKRILEYLAVRKLNPDMKGPILCFVGPPGVGKTSLGRSIARALGRSFVRISLGGVRDEAEIRGHRRTYVGAMPGRIIQSLKRAGTNNPVFMLDEVDKVGSDFRGDPSSALLEVLDPEQNDSFSDHYLDLAFDLSKVVFVTTANVLDTIPPPLRDRMEIIEIPGYTEEDKLVIAKRYLIPRQRAEHGLKANQFSITAGALKQLISGYTREAGVRNLEREIGSVCRFAARAIAEGEAKRVKVNKEDLAEILGQEKFIRDTAMRTTVPGVATGMAWTPTGGDILFIESTIMPGRGRLNLTGQLGEVMKESAQAAVSYVRSKAESLGIDPKRVEESDLHIHVPAGAIPKDGPSAGVALFTSLVSLLTGRPVAPDVSMTGEITLRGHVLPVGGIKEKVLAAQRAGIKKIILPKRNERDLAEVPEQAKKGLTFVLAERVDQVIKEALRPAPAKGGAQAKPASKTRPAKPAAGQKRPKAGKPAKQAASSRDAEKKAARRK